MRNAPQLNENFHMLKSFYEHRMTQLFLSFFYLQKTAAEVAVTNLE